MLENAVYSVISPESCAAIIYRDSGKAELAAMALKLTAPDLVELGIVDGIIPEPEGGAHEDHDRAAELMRDTLRSSLADLTKHSGKDLVDQRYEKFRKMGSFFTEGPAA
jgi:acetyl-CoA carboxylase carboxyl transferase subunit alpha